MNVENISHIEKLRLLIRGQIKTADEQPNIALGIFRPPPSSGESEKPGFDENETLFIDAFAQIIGDGARDGVFNKMDALPVSLIVRDFCLLWGISETIRSACNQSREDYENRIMAILCNGIEAAAG